MAYIEKLQSFDVDSLPNLDVAVMGALELFSNYDLPALELDKFKRPLVVGSGNAAACGQILFSSHDAVFATESTFRDKLQNIDSIDGVVIISASGSKHATLIAEFAVSAELPVLLITNTADSPAEAKLDPDNSTATVFPKNREPYTYNTSTYLGMILAKTGEDPHQIKDFIDTELAGFDYSGLAKTTKFFMIVPPHLEAVVPMLDVKFTELFGRQVARDIKTSEYMLHATTVVPSDEVFISFGEENKTWGAVNNRLHIPLPDRESYGAMMAIGYYVVGQIQKHQPDYFKQNILSYTKRISDIFGLNIDPIVG